MYFFCHVDLYRTVACRGERDKVQFELRPQSHENNKRCATQC